MKTPDLTRTWLFQRYGVTGLRRFTRVWYPIMYVWVIGPTAVILWSLWYTKEPDRILIGGEVCVISLIGVALLTRMLQSTLRGIQALDVSHHDTPIRKRQEVDD